MSAKLLVAVVARDLFHAARYYVVSRTGLLGIAAVATVAGAALNWNWLVASGVAPILLTLLPCALMCGLGLCAHRLAGGSCAQGQSRADAETGQIEASRTQLDLFETATPALALINQAGEAQPASPEAQTSDERRHTHA